MEYLRRKSEESTYLLAPIYLLSWSNIILGIETLDVKEWSLAFLHGLLRDIILHSTFIRVIIGIVIPVLIRIDRDIVSHNMPITKYINILLDRLTAYHAIVARVGDSYVIVKHHPSKMMISIEALVLVLIGNTASDNMTRNDINLSNHP